MSQDATSPVKASLVATLLATRGDVDACRQRLMAAHARAEEVEPWLKAFCHRRDVATDLATGSNPILNDALKGEPASAAAPSTGPFDSAFDLATLASTPLAGIPVAIKDLMASADMPTTYGSPIYANHRPTEDAWITARIREAGGVIFGKTVTTEFAWREPGPTVNPWNRLHTPGGSSSGSAAAVGAGIVALATGTQTVGSVLRPAAFCGVVGYKPSHGKIPTTGVHPLAPTLDHVGFFATHVEDAALAHALFIDRTPEVIASSAQWNRYFADGAARAPKRIAVVRTPLWDRVSPEQKANFETALQRLRDAGVALVDPHSFDDMPRVLEAVQTLLAVEAAAAIGPATSAADPGLLSQHMHTLIAEGKATSDAQYQEALALRSALRASFKGYLNGCDAIVTVAATGEAPVGLNSTGDPSFCAPWSFLGVPAVTVPSGKAASGMPLGLQVIGDVGQDLATLQTAAWIENIVR